jgi:hypothetical protein
MEDAENRKYHIAVPGVDLNLRLLYSEIFVSTQVEELNASPIDPGTSITPLHRSNSEDILLTKDD